MNRFGENDFLWMADAGRTMPRNPDAVLTMMRRANADIIRKSFRKVFRALAASRTIRNDEVKSAKLEQEVRDGCPNRALDDLLA